RKCRLNFLSAPAAHDGRNPAITTGMDAPAELTSRTLFPGSMRIFRGGLLKHACTGHRKPLQRVSLGSFLMSSRHHPNVVPGEATSGYRRRAACPVCNGPLPSVWLSRLCQPGDLWLLLWAASSHYPLWGVVK